MGQDIDNSQDVMDSRDFIAHMEELESEIEAHEQELFDKLTEGGATEEQARDAIASKIGGPDDAISEQREELARLQSFAAEASGSPDWAHGETIIRESYFTDYIEQLIDDCYSLPKEMKSGEWPWRHMAIDFDAAAAEAKADYIEADFDGATYLIRA